MNGGEHEASSPLLSSPRSAFLLSYKLSSITGILVVGGGDGRLVSAPLSIKGTRRARTDARSDRREERPRSDEGEGRAVEGRREERKEG